MFYLTDKTAANQLLDQLGKKFNVQLGESENSRLTFYDTFEWSLLSSKLAACSNGQNFQICNAENLQSQISEKIKTTAKYLTAEQFKNEPLQKLLKKHSRWILNL